MQPIIRRIWSFPTDIQLRGKDGHATFKGTKQLRDTVADHIEKVGTALTTYNQVDILANRPPPGMMGRKFFATDISTLFTDNGTSWTPAGGYSFIGSLSSRPPAGQNGRIFFANDTQTLFQDNGTTWIPIGGSQSTLLVKTSTISLTATTSNNLYILDTTSNNITVTLPPATGSNFAPIFKKVAKMNNLFMQPAGTDTIDGNSYPSGYLVTSIWRKLQLVDYVAGKWAIL